MKKVVYQSTKLVVSVIAKSIGPIHAPYTHKRLYYRDVQSIEQKIRRGDILLSRTHGELTTVMIPGYWKHAAMYVGANQVIEAKGDGVQLTHLVDFVLKTDNIVVLRLNQELTSAEKDLMCSAACSLLGRGYDFDMESSNVKKVYCSELAYAAINAIRPGFIEFHVRIGMRTITPNDLYEDKDKFVVIYENREK